VAARSEIQDSIRPVEFGWTNVARYADYASRDMSLRENAGRYECGTLNTIGCYGLRASIEFLLEVGIERVSNAVLDLAARIERGVNHKGYEVMGSRTATCGSGIVTFRKAGVDARQVVGQLREAGIIAAPRLGWIRTSPHFYVSPDEIERMLDALP
jgi:selenocysteine lyase/cysteine desulfurase